MAYLKALDYTCQAQFCKKRATQELYNFRNAALGKFCAPHARSELRLQQQSEAEHP